MKPSSTKDIAKAIFSKYNIRYNADSINQLADLLVPLKLHYREFLQTSGKTVDNLYYIETGLVRTYHLYENTEYTDGFYKEGDMVLSPDCLYSGNLSTQNIITIEPTIVFSFSYTSIQRYAAMDEVFCHLLCAIMEERIITQQAYINMLILPTLQRFKLMSKFHSDIIWRSPSKSVASYLRMAPETLSRIRTSYNDENSDS
ncbi:MAG: Crp/Fnr family transcriptional regulator [Bacteroidaceae bacterium]|nr:Crp/Fnr family transcriptional regulator [Bacteroidaceae bacterium]